MGSCAARLLEDDEVDDAASLLARAFQDDPMTCFTFPNREHRAEVLPRYLRPGVWLAQHLGAVWCSDDISAVACWRRPGARHASREELTRAGVQKAAALLDRASGDRADKSDAFLAARAEALEVPPAHWYLAMIGVDPDRRRQGLGSAVLRPVLDMAQTRREPVFLETWGQHNTAFYTQHGLALIESGEEPTSQLAYWLFLRRNDAQ